MNFKNHFELYKALIEGKTIICKNGTMVKASDNLVLISCDNGESWSSGSWSFNNPEQWKIYEEPAVWYRITALHNDSDRPYTNEALYESIEDFLLESGEKEKDFQWIHLEEFKRG